MKILRATDYRRMPWKNGGGETVEIAVFPDDAGLADFDWRISMATVATDGPFSVFPGIDRTLSILDGAGMTLFIEGRDPVLLTRQSDPLPFPADAPTAATLADGPITDLNVMTRRDRLSHDVERMVINGAAEILLEAERSLLLCDHGSLDIAGDDGLITLSDRDCLLVEEAPAGRLTLSGKAQIVVIRLRKI